MESKIILAEKKAISRRKHDPRGKIPYFRPLELTEEQKKTLSEFIASPAIEIEIGCGKAKFLIDRARRYPDVRFIALDRVAKWMNIGRGRALKAALPNMFFLKAEAYEFVESFIPLKSVDRFHVYFPDPWPKKRHHKRRLVNLEFLALLHTRVKKNGYIFLATDDADYKNEMLFFFEQQKKKWKLEFFTNNRFGEKEYIPTSYEAKYATAGKPLYYLKAAKL